MSHGSRLVFATVAALALTRAGVADDRDDRVEHWREDLKFLATELPKRHLNLFHALPKEEFEAAVGDLDQRLPDLEDREIEAEIARLVASVGDSHTSVDWGSPPFRLDQDQLELRWFPDGVRVIGAPSDQAGALGARLLKVGDVAFDEAWTRVGSVIAHENEACLRAIAPTWLAQPRFLHSLGLADGDAVARLTVAKETGESAELEVRARAIGRGVARAAPQELPLWLKRRSEPYWFEPLVESKTLYLQYNECRDDPLRPFAELVEQLFAAADQSELERFVIDLRHNSGGASRVMLPLFAGLANRRRLRSKGHLFVAIDAPTASSAMLNAIELKQGYGAILVGQPTSGKPNSYGEIQSFELPRSKIRVRYCTKYFELAEKDTPSLEPDLAVPMPFADWKSGRDPVLQAILEWKADAPPPPDSNGARR